MGPGSFLARSILVACIFSQHGSSVEIDVRQFASQVVELMNKNLGVKHMQNEFNRQGYDRIQLKGKEILEELIKSLTKKIETVRETLLDWKKLIEEDYRSTTAIVGEDRDLVPCCAYKGPLQFNYHFETMMNSRGVCELTYMNKNAKSSDFRRINLQKAIAFTKKGYSDMANKGLYIYYGQEDGYYLQYPAMNYESVPDCHEFDPRIRPWYISAATQKSKDVVALIDVSSNVNKTLFKELVLTFLRTLDARDKIAVIPFADKIFSNPDECYNTQLVKASPGNLLALRRFTHSMIDKSSDHGSNLNYAKGFNEAFKRFSSTSGNPEKLIFLVTSGRNTHSEEGVLKEIADGNRRFEFKIVINSFVINALQMSTGARRFHGNIVDQNCGLYKIKECTPPPLNIRSGKLVAVQKQLEMRKKFGTFLNFIEDESEAKVRYSFPYLDYFGHAILIAMSIPTYYKSKLKGVASIDLVVSELLSDVTYFKEGHNAYRFLIEKSGLVYQHPLLPQPLLALEPTVPVDISLFETAKAFKTIRTSMIRGGFGNESMLTNRSLSRGDSSLEGAIGLAKNYTYFWQSIPLTNFSLGVVIETSNSNQYQINDQTQPKSPMVYHRIDKLQREPKYSFCRRNSHIALNGRSVIKLPADAFGSPRTYYSEETQNIVKEIMDFFSSSSSSSPTIITSKDFANNLKKSVDITSSLDAFWTSVYSPYVAWRYIATEDGVFRIFPGVQIHPLYDPRNRPWYQRSLLYPNTAVLSTPYLDDTSQSMIITFSQLLQKKNDNTMNTVAVMGLDFSMYQFGKFLMDNIVGCRTSKSTHSCIVLDKSGLIVYHPDFSKAQANQQLEGQHITKMLPTVASDLIAKKLLIKKSCIGIHKSNKSSTNPVPHLQYFYLLDVTRVINVHPSALADCPQYKLLPVPNTNAYVLSVRNSCLKQSCCPCPKDGTCRTLYPDHTCHCPCKNFLRCDEALMTMPTDLVCPPPPTNLLLPVKTKEDKEKELIEAQGLQSCQKNQCGSIENWGNCTKIGCQWCFMESSGKLLPNSDQFCGFSEKCPRGRLLSIKHLNSKSPTSNSMAVAIPVVIGCIFAIVLTLGLYIRRKKLPHCNNGSAKTTEGKQAESHVQENTKVTMRKPRSNELAI